MTAPQNASRNLPANAGVSLKPEHYIQILNDEPDIAWFEIHPENYMGNGGESHHYLEIISERYPLSMHSVGMSLGSADGLSTRHLNQLKKLLARYKPAQLSDHLAWSRWDGKFLNDLLPLPYTHEALNVLVTNITQAQDYLQQSILIENPSVYLAFDHADFTEGEFLQALCDKTGCGILLDLNNIFVSATNQKQNPSDLLATYRLEAVKEIHLAGHAVAPLRGHESVLIDDHGSAVCDEVWALYKNLIAKAPNRIPTLIEWDTNIPELAILLMEAQKADAILDEAFPVQTGK